MADSKISLRKSFSKKRLSFVREQKDSLESFYLSSSQFLSQLLLNEILSYDEFQKFKGSKSLKSSSQKTLVCALYSPKNDEAKLVLSYFPSLFVWAYPKRNKESLDFYTGAKLEENELGFKEPLSSTGVLVDIQSCVLVVVPGLCFDKKGGRLGSGKGFYDRALKGYRGVKVGLCFSFQVLDEELPFESHDISMDYIVTEKDLLKINNKNKDNKGD